MKTHVMIEVSEKDKEQPIVFRLADIKRIEQRDEGFCVVVLANGKKYTHKGKVEGVYEKILD